jgi:hypothetical protein
VRRAKTGSSSESSPLEITGDVCNWGEIVGNMWAQRLIYLDGR